MKKRGLTGEMCVNLCLFALSAFYLAYTLANYKIGTARAPKEGFLPLIIGAGATALSAFLAVRALCGHGDAQNVRLSISWPRFGLFIAVSLAYAFLLKPVGYSLSTFLFLYLVLLIARAGGWVKILVISAASSAAFYLIFHVALGVLLPTGFLGF